MSGAPGPEPSLAEARLQGLIEVSRVLGAARTFDDVIRLSAVAARAALDAASVSISRWDPHLGQVRTLVNAGELTAGEEPFPQDETHPLSDDPAVHEPGDTARGLVYTADSPSAPRGKADLLRRTGRHSAVVVPIVLEGRIWGEFYATRRRGQPVFADVDLAYATAVAAHIAAGIGQAGHLEQANRLAYADPLTGLANRRAFDERLDQVMERHRRDGRTVSVLLCDLNRLKSVNDQRGHESGDRLLLQVAGLLSAASARLPDSLAARLGGDEFCLVVEGPPADVMVGVAERLSAEAAGLPGGYGVSVGVASTGDPVGHVDTPKRLLRLADAAQYRAKRSRSTQPVVAGRRLPAETASALPPVPDIEPGHPERRRAFPRSTADPVAVLVRGLAALDGSGAEGVPARLEVVADAVARQLDAAGWWVSHVRPGERVLRTASWSVYRQAATTEVDAAASEEYDLDDYPWSDDAVRGGGYTIEAGAPDNDPAEDAVLVAGGYTGAAAGGVTTSAGGWLVEVFTDEISARVEGLAPVMRALAGVAANPHPGGDVRGAP